MDRLNVDAQVATASLTLILEAAADCLEIANGRDNTVNGPGLSFAVRPALEVAGQIAWLLDDSLDGSRRARRYLIWRFRDLRQQRLLLDDFRPDNSSAAESAEELDEVERGLLADVAAARWQASPTSVTPNGITAAVLLDEDGKPDGMPKINELVRLVSSTRSVYPLLSVPAHGVRFGMYHGLDLDNQSNEKGQQQARIAGFSIDTNLLIGLAVLAVNRSARLLAGWNGLDAAKVHGWSVELMRRAGIA